jgi:hypothetical protein
MCSVFFIHAIMPYTYGIWPINQLPIRAPASGNDTRLVSIDVSTGASADLAAGGGAMMNPSPLSGDDLGYVRKDSAGAGAASTTRAANVAHAGTCVAPHGPPTANESSFIDVSRHPSRPS